MGAAILCSDEVTTNTVTGCNVENASYGLTVCAERTAVLKAVSEGFTEISSIAIAADLGQQFVGPCGMCRYLYTIKSLHIPLYHSIELLLYSYVL